ncbi:MAG: ribosome silencing factor [Nitrospinae bacterium]|nr:ribosome silencing factor [Nitrospinota bacterium]
MFLSHDKKISLGYKLALEKKAYDLIVFDLRGYSYITDFFMICSGNSTRQVRAIADVIMEEFKKEGIRYQGLEGYDTARWILIDYDDLIIHIFHEETRRFYDIERLWGSTPKVEVPI